MTKIPSGAPPSAQTPVAPQPASSGAPGALGLGVDVGIIADAQIEETFRPAADKVEASPSNDRADETREPREQRRTEQPLESKAAGNPFKNMPQAQSRPAARTMGKPVDVEVEIDLPVETLGKLAKAEAELGAKFGEAFDKIRQGNLMLTHDGQTARESKAPMDGEQLSKLAVTMSKMAGDKKALKEHTKLFAQLQAKMMAGGKIDVQALVQRVLRECYQIQNLTLADRAEKVKFQNEQKKKLRARAQEGRDTLAKWRTQEKGNDSFISEEPFLCAELGDDGEWYKPKMDESDVKAWHAAMRNSMEARQGDGDVSSSYGSFFSSESRLTADDEWILKKALDNPDAEWIDEHIGEVTAVLSVMNKAEFDEWVLEPGTQNLMHSLGTQDMEAVTHFLETMAPVQALYMMAHPVMQDPLNAPRFEITGMSAAETGGVAGGGGMAAAIAQAAASGAVFGPIGALFGSLTGAILGITGATGAGIGAGALAAESQDWFNGLNDEQRDDFQRALSGVFQNAADEVGFTWDGELTSENAAALLDHLSGKFDSEENLFNRPPKVGDDKTVNVPDQLDAYLESLEQQIQQLGDDAQIANVELQDALQKQQQTLQMMSNIAKMMHDTAMAIVRKMGQ